MIRLSVAVQHHPVRTALLDALLVALSGCDVEVVSDPDPDGVRSAWRTYREALETTPAWASHRLVVQDDATPCRDFTKVVERAITARPGRMLALCVCGNALATVPVIYRSAQNDESWAVLNSRQWVPAVAVVWPVRMIEPGLAFVDKQHWPEGFNADDEIIGRIVNHLEEHVLCTVPSLVEHNDLEPSAAGERTMYGRDPGRVTACPPPADCDLLSIDWARGPQ